MKKICLQIGALILALCTLLPLAACGTGNTKTTESPINAQDLVDTLLEKVTFDTELSDSGSSASAFFPDLPEYALVTMYSGSGYYADELTWITVAQESDMEQARKSVDTHLEQIHDQFLSYLPDELDKIENPVIWQDGVHLILCITNDYKNAQAIVNDPEKAITGNGSNTTTAPETTEEETTQPETTEPETTAPDTTGSDFKPTVDPDVSLNADGYPALESTDQSSKDCGNACIVDNMAFEYYGYSQSTAQTYASLVSKVAQELSGTANVYDLIIPTAIGVVFPDNLVQKYSKSYEKQGERIQEIFSMMDSNVIPVNCFENLMCHRNEYLYFRTDWHWNGLGAYYAYESFCHTKGITPYTTEQRKLTEFDGYLGALYWQTCGEDPALSQTPDVVQAYHPYSESAYMYYTDRSGNRYQWNIISDVSNYDSGYKYNTFAASDQPFAEFYNPDVTDGSVAIVIKESFGNALLPYLVDHYSTIYEIDYRYWSGDLVEFAKEKGADDVIFANNIGMIRSDYLVGLLDKIIP